MSSPHVHMKEYFVEICRVSVETEKGRIGIACVTPCATRHDHGGGRSGVWAYQLAFRLTWRGDSSMDFENGDDFAWQQQLADGTEERGTKCKTTN